MIGYSFTKKNNVILQNRDTLSLTFNYSFLVTDKNYLSFLMSINLTINLNMINIKYNKSTIMARELKKNVLFYYKH